MCAVKNNKTEGKEIKLCISCPVETKVLQIIRTFITSISKEMGFDEEDSAKIEIAVDEACANVVCHAYSNLKHSPELMNYEIKLSVAITANCLKIEIQDFGIGAQNGLSSGVNEIDEYLEKDEKHGLGTYIIKKFMDKVEFDYFTQKGTKVSMTKYLPEQQI